MDSKFKHSTCKEDLYKKRLQDIIDVLTSKFVIYLLILVFVYSIPLILFYINPLVDLDWFSFWLGIGAWSVFYSNSQEIINLDQFIMYIILCLFIVMLSGIMILITDSNFLNFRMTLYPLFYILYFRILLFLFYRNFASADKKPTILFARRFRKWTHENPDPKYVVSIKEKIFSNLLFSGSIALIALTLLLK